MINREDFNKTFDKLHASPEVLEEVLSMTTERNVSTKRRRFYMPRTVAVACAMVLIIGTCGSAYAMDIGGIQRTVQIWLHGDQTNATLTVENGSYSLDYIDENGKPAHQGGGGVAINEDGTERNLTEEELWEDINRPEVDSTDDGKVICYFMDQKMDITDKFNDDICYLQLNVEGHAEYMTIKRMSDGIRYAMSPHGYINPKELDY